MMTDMHTPSTLPTNVSDSVPDQVEALGWGAFEGPTSASG